MNVLIHIYGFMYVLSLYDCVLYINLCRNMYLWWNIYTYYISILQCHSNTCMIKKSYINACIHGCMYVLSFVCVYAWLYLWIPVWIMCICLTVCFYVCMHDLLYEWLCMIVCMDGWHAWMCKCRILRMYLSLYVFIDVCMYVWQFACIYVCTCIYVWL